MTEKQVSTPTQRMHHRQAITYKLAALFALVLPLAALGQNPAPTCSAPPHTRVVASLRDLNHEVRSALLVKTPDIVDRDQPFDATDVVMHGAHFNRFAFAWQGNGRWIVATEHGGIAYSNPVYTMIEPLSPGRGSSLSSAPARIVNTVSSRPSNLCADVQRALQDKLPPLPAKPASVPKG